VVSRRLNADDVPQTRTRCGELNSTYTAIRAFSWFCVFNDREINRQVGMRNILRDREVNYNSLIISVTCTGETHLVTGK